MVVAVRDSVSPAAAAVEACRRAKGESASVQLLRSATRVHGGKVPRAPLTVRGTLAGHDRSDGPHDVRHRRPARLTSDTEELRRRVPSELFTEWSLIPMVTVVAKRAHGTHLARL